ncbi:MAG TPA: polyprenyl synthetase family protein [Chitinophagaceae bacterium]|nr:polyprenyl synthetase family protein [Chitinophagaceae bacterium]
MQSFRNIVQQFEQKILSRDLFPKEPANLYEPCRYLLSLGGKRIRPAVCLMANELFGPIKEEAWHAAVAIELFHNFTLIHDDIMDKAPLRRGFPTIHAKYGLTAGILGGDAMSIYAYQSLAGIETNFKAVLQVFNTTAIQVCEGQQLDMDFEARNDVSIEEYINMISLKTSVLLAASMKIGALIANAPAAECERLYAFGKNLGIAFQLQDDFLDAFGKSNKLGKQQGGDIIANKKTFLHLQAVAAANKGQHLEIMQWLDTEEADQKVPAMLRIFEETGADQKCRDAVAHYSDLAFENLTEIALPDSQKEDLRQLAGELLYREM